WVEQVYCDLFDRALDGAGAITWPGLLDAGFTRHETAQIILTSTPHQEHFRNEVRRLYLQYLDRTPEATGLQGWLAFLQRGGTEEQMAGLIAGSPEYLQRNGADADSFLNALYHDALGRAPDAGGRAGFTQFLAAGS